MPRSGIISVKTYSSTADNRILSPAVFAFCPGSNAIDDSRGTFVYDSFEKGTCTFATHIDSNGTSTISSFASTVISPGDHVLALTSGSTVNTATGAVTSMPLGPIAPGGKGLWFEANVIPASSTAAQTAFIGLTISTGLQTTTFFATESTLSTGLPLVGFYMTSTTPNNVSCVYQASSGGLQTVLANVLTASTANPNPGNLTYSPFQAPGAFLSSTANAVKLGIEYQPTVNYINFFVNGYLAAQFQPTAATFDTVDSFGAIVAIGGPNRVLYVDSMTAASQWAL